MRKIMRAKLSLFNDEVIIIYTGRINYEKNPGVILEACKSFANDLKLHFLFIGRISANYHNHFKFISKNLKVTILPPVPNKELQKYYNASDIACWPKFTSLSAIEAASCGLPIIISKMVKERVAFGNGIAIEDENLLEIADAIRTLAQNNPLRKKMGILGRKLIENKYSYTLISQKFIDLYKY